VPQFDKVLSRKVSAAKACEDSRIGKHPCESLLIIGNDILQDIADVGPPLSPPAPKTGKSRDITVEDPEVRFSDEADIKSGATEVENDLAD
jgi:hypothetical protein